MTTPASIGFPRTSLALRAWIVAVAWSGAGCTFAGSATFADAPTDGVLADGGPATGDAGVVDDAATLCRGLAPQPLDDEWTLQWGGRDRTAWVHVPQSYDPTRPTPVVFGFHGYSFNAAIQVNQSRMIEASDAEGFIAVHPNGTGLPRGWNAGDCCGSAAWTDVDDVGLVGAILDELEARLCVDRQRIFATGFSNGGFLAHRLGCELPDRIAAIASVSGVMGVEPCVPSRPVAVLHIHGTHDLVVPYGGGGATGFRSVAETIAGWAQSDACPPGAPVETFRDGDAQCESRQGCADDAEVSLCTIAGGGHQWPGGRPILGAGHFSVDLDATAAIWTFFVAHPMRSASLRGAVTTASR